MRKKYVGMVLTLVTVPACLAVVATTTVGVTVVRGWTNLQSRLYERLNPPESCSMPRSTTSTPSKTSTCDVEPSQDPRSGRYEGKW
jgi:hypothetical protein